MEKTWKGWLGKINRMFDVERKGEKGIYVHYTTLKHSIPTSPFQLHHKLSVHHRPIPIFNNAPTTSTSSQHKSAVPSDAAYFFLWIYTKVFLKCFVIISGVWTPSMRPGGARWEGWTSGEEMLSMLDVISSTRLLTNLGATCENKIILTSYLRTEIWRTYSWSPTIKVVKIMVEGIAVKLNRHNFFNRRICDTKWFLQTLKNTLAILVRILWGQTLAQQPEIDTKITHGLDIVLSVVLCWGFSLLNNWLLSALNFAFGRWQTLLPP